MAIKGDFQNVLNFLSSLLNLPRLVTISEFKINSDGEGKVEVDIKASTYINLQGGEFADGI